MKSFFQILIIVCVLTANGAYSADKIDPKLDLQESKELTNSSDKTTNINTKTSSPKIHGLRVTVDTTGVKKSKEVDSNESVEIINKKNSRKIGIHTDITFEITGNGNNKDDSNVTSIESGLESGDQDASVPIFKGKDHHHKITTTTTTHKPKKPYNPRNRDHDEPSQWPINIPTGNTGNFYPQHNPRRYYPIYTRPHQSPNNNNNDNDDFIYRSIDNWSNFVPITSIWTTERTYYPAVSNTPQHQTNYDDIVIYEYKIPPSTNDHYYPLVSQRQQKPVQPKLDWKPCFCLSDTLITGSSWKNKRHSDNGHIESSTIQVNSKLENPFSDKRK